MKCGLQPWPTCRPHFMRHCQVCATCPSAAAREAVAGRLAADPRRPRRPPAGRPPSRPRGGAPPPQLAASAAAATHSPPPPCCGAHRDSAPCRCPAGCRAGRGRAGARAHMTKAQVQLCVSFNMHARHRRLTPLYRCGRRQGQAVALPAQRYSRVAVHTGSGMAPDRTGSGGGNGSASAAAARVATMYRCICTLPMPLRAC